MEFEDIFSFAFSFHSLLINSIILKNIKYCSDIYSTEILKTACISVSPPAFVISPSLTPVALLLGSCLKVIVSVPVPKVALVVTVNSNPIGLLSPSKSAYSKVARLLVI